MNCGRRTLQRLVPSVVLLVCLGLSGCSRGRTSSGGSPVSASGRFLVTFRDRQHVLLPTRDLNSGVKTWGAVMPDGIMLIMTPTGALSEPGYYHITAYVGDRVSARWQTRTTTKDGGLSLVPTDILERYGETASVPGGWPDTLVVVQIAAKQPQK